MRDSMYDDTAVRLSLAPTARAANGAVNGTAVDTAGTKNNFRAAMLVAIAGVITDGNHAVTVQESDDGITGWAAVPAGAVQSSVPTLTTANDESVYRVGIDVNKRYLRAVITTSGAPGSPIGGIVSAIFLLSDGSGRPVT